MEGAAEYPYPENWRMNVDLQNTCDAYDDQGRLPSAGDSPQHYWQCAEVKIESTGPPTPTPAPATSSPVTPPPTPAPVTPVPLQPQLLHFLLQLQ
mmetsp:Transcript_21015/g.30286  ORF Transcript_21015/g.30286 Transcript_21015/m.30286 type:complete len:95 (+) Transcript_21015:660-944(+)